MIKKYNYTGQSQFDGINEINAAINKAYQEYNNFKRSAQSSRWNYLERIAQEYDKIDGKGIQIHFRILQRNEQSKEYFRRIRYCEGKVKGGGVDKIQLMTEGITTTIYDKEQIEHEIMRVNQAKLLQAIDTSL